MDTILGINEYSLGRRRTEEELKAGSGRNLLESYLERAGKYHGISLEEFSSEKGLLQKVDRAAHPYHCGH